VPPLPRQSLLLAARPWRARVEAVAVLVGAGCALLFGVGVQQRAVHVHHQQVGVRIRASGPGPATCVGAGGADAGQAELVTSNLFDHSPGGRGGGDLAEQLRLVPQGRQVAEAVATVGQQHRKIPQHPAGLMAMPRVWDRSARQPSAAVSPSRSANSASSAAPAWLTTPVPSAVTSKPACVLVACTRKVPSSSGECDLQQAAFSQLRGALALQRQRHSRHSRKAEASLRSPCGEARSGVKIGRGRPLTSYVLGRLRPEASRTLGAALWALQCRLEHAD
jgi:hypothetical protein